MIEVGLPQDHLPILEWHKRLYDKQHQFILSPIDFWETLFVAGNGTGKTRVLYLALIELALGFHPWCKAKNVNPPFQIKVLLNDFEHGLEKVFRETAMMPSYMFDKSQIGRILPPSAIKGDPDRPWTQNDRAIYFTNESVIFFQTSEQKKKLHSGTNIDILGCDEEPEKQHYDESKRGLRNAKGGGLILHSFTPPFDDESKNKGPSWTKFDLVDPIERNEYPEGNVIKASMRDNPAITQDFIKRFSRGKTEQQIRIQIHGEYPVWGRLIHPDFQDYFWDPKEKSGHLLPDSFEIPWNDSECQFEMSLDWHGSKPPAVIWTFEYLTGPNKGDVIVFDELSPQAGKGLTISGTAQAIREIEGWRNIRIKRWGDPKMRDKNNALISGFSPWDEFRHNGIRLHDAYNREPYVGYSIVNDFLRGKSKANLEHPRLFIRENCKSLRHNLKNHYNVAKSDGTAMPDTKFNDYCVNLKYIMLNKSRKIKKGMHFGRIESRWPLTSIGEQYLNPHTLHRGIYVPK